VAGQPLVRRYHRYRALPTVSIPPSYTPLNTGNAVTVCVGNGAVFLDHFSLSAVTGPLDAPSPSTIRPRLFPHLRRIGMGNEKVTRANRFAGRNRGDTGCSNTAL
jgi:hypothetical protein